MYDTSSLKMEAACCSEMSILPIRLYCVNPEHLDLKIMTVNWLIGRRNIEGSRGLLQSELTFQYLPVATEESNWKYQSG
jgi:hypothetical protein